MGQLSKLPNIGKEIERQLNEVGIFTYDVITYINRDINASKNLLKLAI